MKTHECRGRCVWFLLVAAACGAMAACSSGGGGNAAGDGGTGAGPQPSTVSIRAVDLAAEQLDTGGHFSAKLTLEAAADRNDVPVELLMFPQVAGGEEVVGVQVGTALLAVKSGRADYPLEVAIPADVPPGAYQLSLHEYSRTEFVDAPRIYKVVAGPAAPQLHLQRVEARQAALLVDSLSTVDPAAPTLYRSMPLSALVQLVSRYQGTGAVPVTAALQWKGAAVPLRLWDSHAARWVEKLLVPTLELDRPKSVHVELALAEADAVRIRPDLGSGPVAAEVAVSVNEEKSLAEASCAGTSSPEVSCRHSSTMPVVIYAASPPSTRSTLAVAGAPQNQALRYEKSWSDFVGSNDVGAGAELSGWAELAASGYSGQVNGGLPMKLVGHAFDFARAKADAAIDFAHAHAGVTVDVVGIHVYSKTYDQPFLTVRSLADEFPRLEKQQSYEWSMAIGFVPITVTLGAAGSFGLDGELRGGGTAANQAEMTFTTGASADIGAFASAMVGAGFGAGVLADLQLVNASLNEAAHGGMTLTTTRGGFPDYLTGSLSEKLTCQARLLSGGIFAFVRYPWVKICKTWGVKYPCGIITKQADQELCSWDGFTIGPFPILDQSVASWTIDLCQPSVTCAGHCGTLFNGCHDVTCGDCPAGSICGYRQANVCGCETSGSCTGKCGTIPDGCGGTMDCGGCTAPQTCGGGGAPNVCGCTSTVSCTGKCGSLPDGCGSTRSCGECTAPQTCGGGGVPNVCGCTPLASCSGRCGTMADGCGGTLSCGGCTAPQTCGGGGTENVCGCTTHPNCSGRQCGSVDDGCGGTASCGTCAAGQTCNGGACVSVATCTDGIRNGQETDVDCGGPTCQPCLLGQRCSTTADCGPAEWSGENIECRSGVCSCMAGWTNCDGSSANSCEVHTSQDVNNCGACNRPCSFAHALATCQSSACVLGTCNTGYANCDGDAANGCETDLNDFHNCGSCGHECDESEQCVNSQCVGYPDLTVTMTHSPAPSACGLTTTATITVKNVGTAGAPPSKRHCWCSPVNDCDTTVDVPALGVGGSYVTTRVVTTPRSPLVTSYCVADSAGTVTESNEANNQASDTYECD